MIKPNSFLLHVYPDGDGWSGTLFNNNDENIDLTVSYEKGCTSGHFYTDNAVTFVRRHETVPQFMDEAIEFLNAKSASEKLLQLEPEWEEVLDSSADREVAACRILVLLGETLP